VSILLTLIGIALIGGGIFILSLVDQAPMNEEEWLQAIVNALGAAGTIVGWIMVILGIILLILGALHLVGII